MRSFSVIRVVFIAVAAFAASSAFANVNLSGLVSGDLAKPRDSAGTSYGSKLGIGGGALVGVPLAPRWEVETGGIYQTRTAGPSALTGEMTANYVQIPALIRYYVIPTVSVGLGGYYAIGVGNVKSTIPGMPAESSFADAGFKRGDYGATGSIGARFPVSSSVGVVIDGRYNLGLANYSLTSTSYKTNDAQILAGVVIGQWK